MRLRRCPYQKAQIARDTSFLSGVGSKKGMTWSVSILNMAFQGEHAAGAATKLPIMQTGRAHAQTAAPRAQAPDFQDWLPLDFVGAQPSRH